MRNDHAAGHESYENGSTPGPSPDLIVPSDRPFRVLCLDGGGMRGIYTASYISHLARGFSEKRGVGPLDVGAGFNLIVGTSTGAIIGCALAAGIPPERIVRLYRDYGARIFRRRVPAGMGLKLLMDVARRPSELRAGERVLRQALTECMSSTTIGDIYRNRNIALAMTAVDMSRHRSWVFKTPHDSNSNHRDDGYTLVDVCLASSAAPLFRSLAAIDTPGDATSYTVFADGRNVGERHRPGRFDRGARNDQCQEANRDLLPWYMSTSCRRADFEGRRPSRSSSVAVWSRRCFPSNRHSGICL